MTRDIVHVVPKLAPTTAKLPAFASLVVNGREIAGGRAPCTLIMDIEKQVLHLDRDLLFPACPRSGEGIIKFFRKPSGREWVTWLRLDGRFVTAGLDVSLIHGDFALP